jgi:hypothetical protein
LPRRSSMTVPLAFSIRLRQKSAISRNVRRNVVSTRSKSKTRLMTATADMSWSSRTGPNQSSSRHRNVRGHMTTTASTQRTPRTQRKTRSHTDLASVSLVSSVFDRLQTWTGRDPGFTTGNPCAHSGHVSGS